MSNYWAIVIGVNDYQHFQTLSYAQADAQAVWNFLVGKAGFMPDRCLLLTDTSPFFDGQSTYPSKENLQKWIHWLCREAIQPGDRLWCFFSGYGVNWENQDYLMPIDGNLANIADTGISVRSLFETIKAASGSADLVLFDLHRRQATQAGALVGSETVELARDLEIPTILSCQPSQEANESAELHHGLFSAALLEGLNSGAGKTAASLKQYLSDRLPSLCEQFGQPQQDVVIVVSPPEKSQKVILANGLVETNGYLANNESQKAEEPAAVGATLSPSLVAVQQHMQNIGSSPVSRNPFQEALSNVEPSFDSQDKPPADNTVTSSDQPATASSRDASEPKNESLWTKVFLWTGGTLLALLVLLLIGNWGRNQFFTSQKKPEGTLPSLSSNSGKTKPMAKSPQQISQERLDKAKVLLQGNRISQFNKAIAQASQIKQGQPLYNEAQEAIDRWTIVIIDTAQGRAAKGNFTEAIAAANLVPKNHPSYKEVESDINRWRVAFKQQQTNRTLLASAKQMVKEGQASSYNDAITVARKIPAGQPGYAQAQKAIAQWSQTILSLAQARATEGDLGLAIKTASLVPPETPAYAKAQQAIAQWKRR